MSTSTAAGPLEIDCESEGFPPAAPVSNGFSTLRTNWDKLLWAAVTVGRPNRQYVFRHSDASQFEAVFRWSLVRMALEQSSPRGRRLRRTDASKTLDPSEKGAVSYFLGMTLCKLFSAELLDAPWVLHLDVFRPHLDPVLTGRSRPDLVGQTRSGDWVALESKGRITEPEPEAKRKAKAQAERLVRIDGAQPSLNIGCITFFRYDTLRFFWRDPEPEEEKLEPLLPLSIREDTWRYYYSPVLELIRARSEATGRLLGQRGNLALEELDIQVAIDVDVLKLLVAERWGDAKRLCIDKSSILSEAGYQPDGIRVVAGKSWNFPFNEG